MLKKTASIFCVLMTLAGLSLAQEISINGKEAHEDATVQVLKDELQAGKMPIAFLSTEDVTTVDVSVDGGHGWNPMIKGASAFSWSWQPLDDAQADIAFTISHKDGSMRVYEPRIRVLYMAHSPEESIRLILDRIKDAYATAQKDRVLTVIASDFPDRIKFEEALAQDFYHYTNIRLRYRIDRLVVAADNTSAMADVYWEKRYSPRSSMVDASTTALIKMDFVRENGNWLIHAMQGNSIFGASLMIAQDLFVSSADITINLDAFKVKAIIHNNSNTEALNVPVRFLKKDGGSPSDSDLLANTVIARIPPNGSASTDYISYPPPTVSSAYFRVIIDADNAIIETNESNNQAAKN